MLGRREVEEEKESWEKKKNRWWQTKRPASQALCLHGGVARSVVSTLYWVTASAEKQRDMAFLWQWISPLLFKTASLLRRPALEIKFIWRLCCCYLWGRRQFGLQPLYLFIYFCFRSSSIALSDSEQCCFHPSFLPHKHTHRSNVPWPLADCLKDSICCGRISMDAPSSPPPLSFPKQLAEGEMHVSNN